MKWCWSRLPGGVVTWDAYELFRIGESGELIYENQANLPLRTDAPCRFQLCTTRL